MFEAKGHVKGKKKIFIFFVSILLSAHGERFSVTFKQK